MKRFIALFVAVLATAALAEDKPGSMPAKTDKEMMGGQNPMAMWKPRKVANEKEDKKGVDALYAAQEAAMKSGDVNAAAANIDFPVFMITDDSKGTPSADSFNKERWMAEVGESMKNMPKDMKMTHKRHYEFLTDSLAIDDTTMTMGKEKKEWKAAEFVVNKDGKWMVKTMAEGGWGDMIHAKGTGGAGNP